MKGQPDVRVVSTGADVFVFGGIKIAKRGHPDTRQASGSSATAARNSRSISIRCSTCKSMSGSKNRMLERPSAFARYNARSACRTGIGSIYGGTWGIGILSTRDFKCQPKHWPHTPIHSTTWTVIPLVGEGLPSIPEFLVASKESTRGICLLSD